MVRSCHRRLWWVRLGLLVAPKALTALWASVSDDYNNINLGEIKAYKKFAAGHPAFVAAVSEMIDFMDPAYGTSEAFAQAVRRLDEQNVQPASLLGYLPIQQAVISRALAGDESALEAAYESWQHAPQYAHSPRLHVPASYRTSRSQTGGPPAIG